MTIDNKKRIAADYIVDFYVTTQQLFNSYAQYANLMAEFTLRFPNLENDVKEGNAKISPEEMQIFSQVIQQVRAVIIKSYTYFTAIKKSAKIKIDKDDISPLYDKIKNKFVMDVAEVEKYVIEMQQTILHDVRQQSINTSSDFLDNVFKAENGNKTDSNVS